MKLLQKPIAPVTPHSTCDKWKWSEWNDITVVPGGRCVVFNTLTRAAVLADQGFQSGLHDLPAKDLAMLKDAGIVVPADANEREDWYAKFNAAKEDRSYIDLTILLTHDCQFRCQYCFEGEKDKTMLSADTENDIMSFLQTQKGTCRRLRVTWFGGEPLLAFPRLRSLSGRLITFCNENGIAYTADITTNGYALNEDRCRELIDQLKVRRYIITLDGPQGIHDKRRPLVTHKPTFDRIWQNIALLLSHKAHVTIRVTIDKENVGQVPGLLDKIAGSPYAGKVGLAFSRTIDYNYTPLAIRDSIYTPDEFKDVEWPLIQYAHKLGLWRYEFPYAAPLGGCLRLADIVVSAEGTTYKCLDTVGDKQWEGAGIKQAFSSVQPSWYSTWLRWTPHDSERCRKCHLAPLCSGGCPHNALFKDKRHGTDTQCPDWKANYKRQIRELALETL